MANTEAGKGMMLEALIKTRRVKKLASERKVSYEEAEKIYANLSEEEREKIEIDMVFTNLLGEHTTKPEEKSASNILGNPTDSIIAVQYEEFCKSIPKVHERADLDTLLEECRFSNEKMYYYITGLREGKHGLLAGPNGCGKTFLAWSLAKYWKKRGESVIVTDASELLAKIKQVQLSGSDPYAYMRAVYGKKLDHLIIDEIDKVKCSGTDANYLSFLVNIRYEEILQTICLGNIKDNQALADIVPQSVYSRMTSADYSLHVKLRGDDKRRIRWNTVSEGSPLQPDLHKGGINHD